MIKKRYKKTQGMTLIEMLVFITIFTVIIVAVVSSIRFVYKGQRYSFETAESTRNARLGIEHTIKDIRESAYSDIGDYPIIAMATSSLEFYSDIDRDAKVERVRYFLDGSTLKKGLLKSTGNPPEYLNENEVVSIVSTNVRNNATGVPLFTYYDKSGAEMTDLTKITDVAFVLARLVVNLEPSHAPNDFELRSSAALRNIISQ